MLLMGRSCNSIFGQKRKRCGWRKRSLCGCRRRLGGGGAGYQDEMGGNGGEEVVVVAETRDVIEDVGTVKVDEVEDTLVHKTESSNRLSLGYASVDEGLEDQVVMLRNCWKTETNFRLMLLLYFTISPRYYPFLTFKSLQRYAASKFYKSIRLRNPLSYNSKQGSRTAVSEFRSQNKHLLHAYISLRNPLSLPPRLPLTLSRVSLSLPRNLRLAGIPRFRSNQCSGFHWFALS